MFVKNKINVKHYNFIFVIIAFLFSTFLFTLFTSKVN